MMLGDKFSNTRFALILGGTLMMTGVAHADQSDILEPFGGSAHPGVIVDTQIAELPATNIPIPHTLIAQLSTNEDDVNDPLESVNRVIFGFNEIVYEFLLTPVATTYNTVLHETVRSGVSNRLITFLHL